MHGADAGSFISVRMKRVHGSEKEILNVAQNTNKNKWVRKKVTIKSSTPFQVGGYTQLYLNELRSVNTWDQLLISGLAYAWVNVEVRSKILVAGLMVHSCFRTKCVEVLRSEFPTKTINLKINRLVNFCPWVAANAYWNNSALVSLSLLRK